MKEILNFLITPLERPLITQKFFNFVLKLLNLLLMYSNKIHFNILVFNTIEKILITLCINSVFL